jgi:hypothetical protein
MIVPIMEHVSARKIAKPALPCFANGKPSNAVAADAGVPGMFRRIADWHPPEIDPTYTPSSAINADCVGKLYVSPVSNAIAMVALSPGRIPISNPESVARNNTTKLYGVNTVRIADPK